MHHRKYFWMYNLHFNEFICFVQTLSFWLWGQRWGEANIDNKYFHPWKLQFLTFNMLKCGHSQVEVERKTFKDLKKHSTPIRTCCHQPGELFRFQIPENIWHQMKNISAIYLVLRYCSMVMLESHIKIAGTYDKKDLFKCIEKQLLTVLQWIKRSIINWFILAKIDSADKTWCSMCSIP